MQRETHGLTRRGFLGGAIGSALLVACGSGGDDAGSSSGGQATPAVAKTFRLLTLPPAELGAPPVPAARLSDSKTAVPYETAIAPYAGFGTDAAPGVFPRTVRHARGSTTIPAAPKRVVALERGAVDILYEIGVKPVAVVDGGSLGYAAHLQPLLSGVPSVGVADEPNYEAIIGTNPDLILAAMNTAAEQRDARLGQIAPSVFRVGSGVVWRHNFALTAQALGQEEKAAEVVKRYEERVTKLNAALPKPRPTFSLIRVLTNNLRYMLRANYAGTILTDLGIPRPDAQNVDDFALLNMSLETLGQYGDADVIIVAIDEGTANPFGKTFLESPLWKSLNGVKAGRVMTVDSSAWIGGIGYQAAHTVLDDIAKQFGIKA